MQGLLGPYKGNLYKASTDLAPHSVVGWCITLFTLYPAKYGTTLSFNLNNQTLPTTKHPKTLGITCTFEPILTFSQYINLTVIKLKQTLKILKALTSNTNKKKPQTIQNTALFIATGCKRDTNIQGLQDKISVLPTGTHLKLHATHLKQMT